MRTGAWRAELSTPRGDRLLAVADHVGIGDQQTIPRDEEAVPVRLSTESSTTAALIRPSRPVAAGAPRRWRRRREERWRRERSCAHRRPCKRPAVLGLAAVELGEVGAQLLTALGQRLVLVRQFLERFDLLAVGLDCRLVVGGRGGQRLAGGLADRGGR